MRRYSLASVVAMTGSGLVANHIPLLIQSDSTPYGTLQGHIARANPLWRSFQPEVDALAIFQGPDAYITPEWYATKQETGKVVPTWNYAVVHAHGTLRIIDDAAWVRHQIEQLTAAHEAASATPWELTDAPAGFIESLLPAVVGIEITITRLEGKWKASQNQPECNRAGVVAGLTARQCPTTLAWPA
ncbi:FMN-binding negative transcriptional regulator [Hymenobacter cellulosilyticus]|uniref:FMN-binding negative transcriptional regulator n=2 Tax=Hymenobacter cellulosilyticus TaxID=2932248 RepID=A0A8T9Q3L6_9BACT|nr:FMN-binding negative transcriptional regulator [Hymenobacter cellulosilyticus]